MLALLLFNMFFAVVISVACTRFKAGKNIMDALEHRRKKRGAGGRGEATAGETVLVTPRWGMLYAEIMCLCTKGMPEYTATVSVEAAGQEYSQTNEFVYLGGNINHNADLFIEVIRRIRNAWCSFQKYTLELYDRTSAPLELKIRMLRAEVFECTSRSRFICEGVDIGVYLLLTGEWF